MPVERRWPAGGRVLERRAKDPEMLFGGEDGDAIELNLFVVISPRGVLETSEIKSFGSTWKNGRRVLLF